MEHKRGNIFNIQRFSISDGPGIRTTVFMKGCNLRCRWCHNPESYRMEPQWMFFGEQCTACRTCEAVCPQHIPMEERRAAAGEAYSGVGLPEGCLRCGRCTDSCLQNAIRIIGEGKSTEDVLNIALRDRTYYENSGGGVTVSGGEPLLQAAFVAELFAALKSHGIHTALDTAGNVPFEYFEQVLPYVDLVLLDLKCMDDARHKLYTGVSNRQILANAERLMEIGQEMHIRVPLIAGVNDSVENMEQMCRFLDGAPCVKAIKLLPYHDLGVAKAEATGFRPDVFAPPSEEHIKQLEKMAAKCISR